MHMRDNLINFLYDKEYFIDIYDKYIHVYNYIDLLELSSTKIRLKLEKFNLNIMGSKLFIIKMSKNELLIKGEVSNIGFIYE